MPEPDLRLDECQQVISQLLQRHDWCLWDEQAFSQHLWERALTFAQPDRDALTRLAVNLYCETWHAACRVNNDRRTRAYTELAHYLYDRALHKYGDRAIAQEITHAAILLVVQQIDQVQNPGAFLAFALLKLWNAATTYFRQRDRQARHTQPLPDPSADDQPGDVADPRALLPEAITERNELERQVRVRVDVLIAQSPRARNQFQAVLLKFLHEYSDAEIAEALKTDVANVHVLRSRGLNRLRADAGLRQLFAEIVDS